MKMSWSKKSFPKSLLKIKRKPGKRIKPNGGKIILRMIAKMEMTKNILKLKGTFEGPLPK